MKEMNRHISASCIIRNRSCSARYNLLCHWPSQLRQCAGTAFSVLVAIESIGSVDVVWVPGVGVSKVVCGLAPVLMLLCFACFALYELIFECDALCYQTSEFMLTPFVWTSMSTVGGSSIAERGFQLRLFRVRCCPCCSSPCSLRGGFAGRVTAWVARFT